MAQLYPHIAAPLAVGSHTMPNRIVVPPMADIAQHVPDGFVTEHILRRYGDLGRGGAGMVVVEGSNVSKAKDVREAIGIWDDAFIPGLSRLAEAVTCGGAVGLIQLANTGLAIMKEQSIAEISRRDFLTYKDDFIAAARRCREAGFDGVELHGAHGYFLCQIIETSERGDEYGRSFANRIRFLIEIIEAIKGECGRDFIVSARFGYPTVDGLVELAKEVEAAGADMVSISTGRKNYKDVPPDFPVDSKIYAAWKVKQAVHIPVIAVGNIKGGADAEYVLAQGYADAVAVGRSHLADPSWAGKVLQGREPNPCFRCKPCRWFTDSRQCPARNRDKRE